MQITTQRPNDTGTPAYPLHREKLPPGELRIGRYRLRFARDLHDLRAVQRLRFRVFNEELNEGLDASRETGLDEDEADARCHHLMVISADGDEVVGTYRVMTLEMARVRGFYSAAEYDLSTLPIEVQRDSVEAGRACVAAEHRNGRVVQLLWRGLARYLAWNDRRYLFGCCSVPTIDPTEARCIAHRLSRLGAMHEDLRVRTTDAFRCPEAEEGTTVEELPLPPLFGSYLKLGAKVLSGPALDREFRVTDFFVLLDLASLESHVRRAFFERGSAWTGERELTAFSS